LNIAYEVARGKSPAADGAVLTRFVATCCRHDEG
jgi:hypothetical protein